MTMTQDAGVREPSVRLRTVLVLLRLIAGRRGSAQVAWRSAGFTYVLFAHRAPDELNDVDIDGDPDNDDPDAPRHRERLVELLWVQP